MVSNLKNPFLFGVRAGLVSMEQEHISYFAQTDHRNVRKEFGIKKPDRRMHIHIIGKSGTGKSTLLKNLIIQDIRNGHGVGLIDPHGDLVGSILDCIPSHRTGDVLYLDPSDHDHPIGFNILESVDPATRPLIASHVISVFKNIWQDSWGPRLEYILYNSVASLLDYEGSTLLGIPRLLNDKDFRAKVIQKIKDPIVKNFWLAEYEQYSQEFQKEAIAPILNKVGQFLTSAPIRNIVGQSKTKMDFGFMMDNQRVLLCDLSKGKIGEDKTSLLGSLIVTKLFLAALQRAKQPESERKDFYLYIDECQDLASSIFASILSEARKYRLNLILAHQYLDQLPLSVKQSIFGNVGTLITFRLGSSDAMELAKEFAPVFNSIDLENLSKHQIYLKMAIDGMTCRPFSAGTLPARTPERNENNRANIIKSSREKFGMKKEIIEDKINRWLMKTDT